MILPGGKCGLGGGGRHLGGKRRWGKYGVFAAAPCSRGGGFFWGGMSSCAGPWFILLHMEADTWRIGNFGFL